MRLAPGRPLLHAIVLAGWLDWQGAPPTRENIRVQILCPLPNVSSPMTITEAEHDIWEMLQPRMASGEIAAVASDGEDIIVYIAKMAAFRSVPDEHGGYKVRKMYMGHVKPL